MSCKRQRKSKRPIPKTKSGIDWISRCHFNCFKSKYEFNICRQFCLRIANLLEKVLPAAKHYFDFFSYLISKHRNPSILYYAVKDKFNKRSVCSAIMTGDTNVK